MIAVHLLRRSCCLAFNVVLPPVYAFASASHVFSSPLAAATCPGVSPGVLEIGPAAAGPGPWETISLTEEPRGAAVPGTGCVVMPRPTATDELPCCATVTVNPAAVNSLAPAAW